MSTLAPPELTKTADEWEALKDYPSAVCSGIVGDLAHALRGGYHISIMDQPKTNYSVVKVDDKAPPGKWRRDYASAIDMNLNLKDMKLCHARVVAVWRNRTTDSRAKYFNAWNGWDGNGSPGRYNFVTGSVETASDDHKWHGHLEVKRRYANDPNMRRAWISIVAGETDAEFQGDEDMTKSEFFAWMNEWARSMSGKEALAVAVLTHDPGVDATGKTKPGGVPNPDAAGFKANPTLAPAWALRQAVLGVTIGNEVNAKLTQFIVDEAARDAQEAARDEGLRTIVEALKSVVGYSLTEEQFEILLTSVTKAVAEAGQDAADQAERKISQIMDALDNASEALAAADDETPPQA